jgi:hypothetical protein
VKAAEFRRNEGGPEMKDVYIQSTSENTITSELPTILHGRLAKHYAGDSHTSKSKFLPWRLKTYVALTMKNRLSISNNI